MDRIRTAVAAAPTRARAAAALIALIATLLSVASLAPAADAARGRGGSICAPPACDFSVVKGATFRTPLGPGYWLATSAGRLRAFGDAPRLAVRAGARDVVAAAAAPHGRGAWLATADGAVRARGTARALGGLAGTLAADERVVALRAARDGRGYWLATDRGRLAGFGSAKRLSGTVAALPRGERVVGFDATADRRGAWLATDRGTVLTLGSAKARGSLAGRTAGGERVVGLRAARAGQGYWLATSRGRLVPFGVVAKRGVRAAGGADVITGFDVTADGRGAWLASAAGGVRAVGTARTLGSLAGRLTRGQRVVGLQALSGPVRGARDARLRVRIANVPRGKRARVIVRGPNGFRRVLRRSRTFTHAAPGRWTVEALPIAGARTTSYTAARVTRLRIARGARAVANAAYTQVVFNTTRVADPDAIVRVDRDGQRMRVVVRDPARMLADARVLSSGVGPRTPDGLLVAIDRIAYDGGEATIVGRLAALTDIGPMARLRATPRLTVTPAAIASAVGHAAASDSPGNFDKPYQCSGGVDASVAGGVGMQIGADLGVGWGGWLDPFTIKAHLILEFDQQAKLRFTVAGKGTCELDVALLKKPIEFSPVTIAVGPVVVVIVPKLNFHITAEGTVKASVSTMVYQSASLKAGVKWDGSRLSPVKDASWRTSYTTPSVSADGSLKAAIGPRLVFSIYGAGGPYLSTGAFGRLAVTTDGDPWWKLTAGLQAGAGLEFKVWKFGFSKGIDDLLSKSWTLAEADGAIPPQVTTEALPGATTGVPYTASLAGSRGKSPYTWSVTGGALPAGLALGANGTISGTPTGAGSSTFTVTLTDAQRKTARRTLSIAVAARPLAVSTQSLADGVVGQPYRAALAGSGGVAPYRWSITAGQLPAGLTLGAGGAIAGTPTAAGAHDLTVTLRSADGQSVSRALRLTVAPAPLALTTQALADGKVGSAYRQTLAASGGTAPYAWSVADGALPAGLALNGETGVIAGTPGASGTTQLTIAVRSADGQLARRQLTIAVAPADLAVATTRLTGATIGQPYSGTLAAAGGTAPYSWAVTSGSLPAGISLDGATGALSGTPSALGTATFTVTVTDGGGVRATRQLTLEVLPDELLIVTDALPGGEQGRAFSQTLEGHGGRAPYEWSIVGGALPAGLSLDAASGTISGTPSSSGTAAFEVQLRDADGATARANLSIRVVAITPVWINDVSCPTETFCMAVDSAQGMVTWDGSDWTRTTPFAANQAVVDCTSATFCVASTGLGAVSRWDGTSWSAPEQLSLNTPELSCGAPDSCVLAGRVGSPETGAAYTWDGTSWTAADPAADAGSAAVSRFVTVSCGARDSCMVYGENGSHAFTWDGSDWTERSGWGFGAIYGVGCSNATWCLAAGSGTDGQVWNGTVWAARQTLTSVAFNKNLIGCVKGPEPFCAITRDFGTADIIAGNGTTVPWSTTTAPVPDAQINGVACASATLCFAVDSRGRAIEWDGTSWSAPVLIAYRSS